HGFAITGPDVTHEVDPAMFATMTEVAQELRPCVDAIDGSIMEAKGYSIAVHYRLVDPARVAGLHEEISRVVREHATVRLSSGKKVLEIRPTRDWHKGRALRWLHDRVLGDGGRRIPLFAGDDLTDEDALREVAGDGIGIFVGTPTWHTAA